MQQINSDVNKDWRHKAKAKDTKNLIDKAKAKDSSFKKKDKDKDKDMPVMTRTDKGILHWINIYIFPNIYIREHIYSVFPINCLTYAPCGVAW